MKDPSTMLIKSGKLCIMRRTASAPLTKRRRVFCGSDEYWLYPTLPDYPPNAAIQGWTFTRVPCKRRK